MTDELHVVPRGDLVEHDSSDDCACGPTTEPIMRPDGSNGWLHVHHSLDAREKGETMLDQPPVSACTDCGRQTWAETEVGKSCQMPQPDGSRCPGSFPASPVVAPSATDETTPVVRAHVEYRDGSRSETERWVPAGNGSGEFIPLDGDCICHQMPESEDANGDRMVVDL